MQHFIHKEPAVQEFIASLSPACQAAIQEIYKLAHVQGVWEMAYDPEDNTVWPHQISAIFAALLRSGTHFSVWPEDSHEGVVGWYAKGWVIWGIGCSGMSAAVALHMDESYLSN